MLVAHLLPPHSTSCTSTRLCCPALAPLHRQEPSARVGSHLTSHSRAWAKYWCVFLCWSFHIGKAKLPKSVNPLAVPPPNAPHRGGYHLGSRWCCYISSPVHTLLGFIHYFPTLSIAPYRLQHVVPKHTGRHTVNKTNGQIRKLIAQKWPLRRAAARAA